MLFIKELKKICFSFIYVLFIGLLLFSWHENFYGVTTKEISASQGSDLSVSSELTVGSILKKPEKEEESYGMKNKEIPEKNYVRQYGHADYGISCKFLCIIPFQLLYGSSLK